MTDSDVLDPGVLVKMRPNTYWTDPATNVTYAGPIRMKNGPPASATFRVSRRRYELDRARNGTNGMFELVPE